MSFAMSDDEARGGGGGGGGGAPVLDAPLMPLPEIFEEDPDQVEVAREAARGAAQVAAAAVDVQPGAVPAAAAAHADADFEELAQEDDDGVEADAPVGNLEDAQAKATREWEDKTRGFDERACPWCSNVDCCRRLPSAVLIQLRARALMTTRLARASGVAYLATALVARQVAAAPPVEGPRRRGRGVRAEWCVLGIPVCRGAFLWTNRFGSGAWSFAVQLSLTNGVYVPPHGRVGQPNSSVQEKANRRAIVVFFVNYVRHYGLPVPATKFSDTTAELQAGTTLRGLYGDSFLPAAIAKALDGLDFVGTLRAYGESDGGALGDGDILVAEAPAGALGDAAAGLAAARAVPAGGDAYPVCALLMAAV